MSSRPVDELADEMEFTADEIVILQQLLSDELRSYLIRLCEDILFKLL